MLYTRYYAFVVNGTSSQQFISFNLHIEEIIIVPKKVEKQQPDRKPFATSRM